jgi:hypothetical protein
LAAIRRLRRGVSEDVDVKSEIKEIFSEIKSELEKENDADDENSSIGDRGRRGEPAASIEDSTKFEFKFRAILEVFFS